MNHRNQERDQENIKNQCLKAKREVSKNQLDKVNLDKQAIWDMYAYYGEPSSDMFKEKKNG